MAALSMKTPACRHGGKKIFRMLSERIMILCGELGYICDACQVDRADARIEKLAERLVEGMALAGLLSSEANLGIVENISRLTMKHVKSLRAELVKKERT